MDKKNIAHKIAKNFSSLIIAQIIYKIITFVMMIIMARFLGVEGFGQFSYGLSFVWVFLFLSDFGLSELFVRDVAAKRNSLGQYINNIIPLKILIAVVVYLTVVLSAWQFSFGTEKFWIILILGASVVMDSFMYFFRSIFRIKETMEYEAVLMVIEALLKLAIVLFVIKLGVNLSGAILMSLVLLSVSFINSIINFVVFTSNHRKIIFTFNKTFWFYLMRSAFPFALIYILSFLNFRIDVIMLSLMKGDISAGWYNACYKLLEQFLIVPLLLSYVYLPLFSRLSERVDNIHLIFKKTILPLFLVGLSIVILCYFFGATLIRIIYGKAFKDAADYVYPLSLVLIPFFIKPIIEKVLYVAGQQVIVFFIYFFGIVSNVILNFLLIPRWGINGASFATLFSELSIVLACLFYMDKKSFITPNFAQRIPDVEIITSEELRN